MALASPFLINSLSSRLCCWRSAGLSEALLGSVPLPFSIPSGVPSPSLSALKGFVPSAASSSSVKPSPSESLGKSVLSFSFETCKGSEAVFIFPLFIAATTFPLPAASILIAFTNISLKTITIGIITEINPSEARIIRTELTKILSAIASSIFPVSVT